ncbi:MAG: 6-pyruvoyl-tetrahydropterin synthase-related protein [Pyrinomonadaceae bacterium]
MRLKDAAPPLFVACAGLAVSLPLWLYGLPLVGDSVLLVSWHERFAAPLFAGELYPRWLSQMSAGLGSPAFFFYAPAPFYFSALLRALLPFGSDAPRTLGVAYALALTASGLTAYAWLRRLCGSRAATAGACLYLLAPYHAAVDLYTREAYAELCAFVWIPLVLLFAERIKTCPRAGLAGLSISYALVALTHLPATLIFSPVPVAYAYFTTGRDGRARATLRVACAMALGAGLASVYLIPALTTQANASLTDMLPHLYYERWATFTRTSLGELYGRIFWGELSSACLVACAAALVASRRDESARRLVLFWSAVCALSLFMTTFASNFLWRLVPVVQKVQFPWRYNINVCAAAAAAAALVLAARRPPDARRAHARLYVFGALLVALWAFADVRTAWSDYEQALKTGGVSVPNAERWVWTVGGDAPEYKPRWANSNADTRSSEIARALCGGATVPATGCVHTDETDAEIAIERWRPRDIALRVNSPRGAALVVAQFYYAGWSARLDGQPLPVGYTKPDGIITLDAPGGSHAISLRLEPARAETAGRVLSACSLALLALVVAAPRRRRASHGA